jgi:carboxymethylenebutenolidase
MTDISFTTPDGPLRGYLATPATAGPWPGVVVIHEAFGLTDDIRRQADRLAAEGYLCLAPDLYSAGFGPTCLVATFRTLVRGSGGRAVSDIDAAGDYLRRHDNSTGSIGVIGFCMGGGFAILVAGHGYDVASPNYGMAPKDLTAALRGSCSVVASYAGRDAQLKRVPGRLESELTTLGVPHDVKTYDDACHGFMIEHTGRWRVVDRIPGLGYDADAAGDAWQRTLRFFEAHLR